MNHIKITKVTLLLLSVALLATMVSCEKKFSPENLVGERWHTILNIKNNGEQTVSVKARNEETVWSLIVMKNGSERSAEGSARLRVMSSDELELLFPDNNYEIIDGAAYEFTPSLHFASDESGKTIDIRLKSKAVLSAIESDPEKNFVLPIELVSGSDSVNANRNYALLSFVDGAKPHGVSGIRILSSDLPDNDWGTFGIDRLFDGNKSTEWRSGFANVKASRCSKFPDDPTAIWCNMEDHDVADYEFQTQFVGKNGSYDIPALPWSVVADMQSSFQIVEVRTTRFLNTIEGGVDMSCYRQRVKDYEYWVSEDNTNWEKVGEGTMPVYGGETFSIEPEQDKTVIGRYLKLVIKTLHWRENTEEAMKEMHGGKSYNEYHSTNWLTGGGNWNMARENIIKDVDYATLKKSSAVDLGPVILNEIEVTVRDAD